MTMRPDAGSKTKGSSSARWRFATTGSYAGNMSSGRRHGPSRSMMLVIVTSPMASLFINPVPGLQPHLRTRHCRLLVRARLRHQRGGLEPGLHLRDRRLHVGDRQAVRRRDGFHAEPLDQLVEPVAIDV